MSEEFCLHGGDIYTGIMKIPQGADIVRDGLIADVLGRERFQKTIFPSETRFIDM